jgi:AcrR family transcriptional regulator
VSRPPLDVPRLRRVPRQARSRERLARLLDAAEELLVTEGPQALTTTRVAAAAGVSVGSLYQYLPDKEAIVEALAGRYLAEFEALMDELAERAPFEDPVGTLVDAFAQRYRERPGYRALWFGREMTPALRTADLENKAALAEGLMRAVGLGEELRTQARAGVLIADALLQEAFRTGSPELIEEAKRVLRLYLEDVLH